MGSLNFPSSLFLHMIDKKNKELSPPEEFKSFSGLTFL